MEAAMEERMVTLAPEFERWSANAAAATFVDSAADRALHRAKRRSATIRPRHAAAAAAWRSS
jgi:hypothetical protein